MRRSELYVYVVFDDQKFESYGMGPSWNVTRSELYVCFRNRLSR